jgi:hydrogenase maturation protein HypF
LSSSLHCKLGKNQLMDSSFATILRKRIIVRGIVQGVGFRPFVYKLAKRIAVRGFIFNSSYGVTIEAEGEECAIVEFIKSLVNHAPPLARIEEITTRDLDSTGANDFEIRESQPTDDEFVLVPPDVATCDECLNDIRDPQNRRFAYPFTNCTNCGPRYTIIRDIPYDRQATTMREFRMCESCEAEYHDHQNRRFHAEPNACPSCGPSLALARRGSALPTKSEYGARNSRSILRDVREALHQGAIIAIKGLGGFQLACDAENNVAVANLRQRKKRSEKPFALMARDLAAVEEICVVSPADRELLLGPQRPIVILARRPNTELSSNIAPGNNTIGVMLAYTPLHFLLFADTPNALPEFAALVMTSGNISDEPIVTGNDDAWHRLSPVANLFLFHNRDIHMRADDSVARTFEGRPRVLRRSRGYAPKSIDLGSPVNELLAWGAELKNTFCVTKGRYAILSQHIGDLTNYETVEFVTQTLTNLKELFRVKPVAVAHDLHPDCLTSRLAGEMPLPRIGVQHHHAHIASCMAENELRGKVIGVAFDGTGYGIDAKIWGGEFLVADFAHFERHAHFRYVPLPGGDVAVRQPWRSALSWLRESYGSEIPGGLALFEQVPERDAAIVLRMIDSGVNTVSTSSCGRLFDAVASILGLRHEATFEGQAAIELETATTCGIEDSYTFEVDGGEPAQIDMRPAIREILRDLSGGESRAVIASRFHNTLAAIIGEVCSRIRKSERLNRVCLSGGTFQNIYLLNHAATLLRRRGFEVFLHSQVPPNDGGVALGQAAIANEIVQIGA